MNARPWPSVTLEGALLSPAMLALVCGPADSPERDAASYGLRKGLSLRDEIATAFRVGQAHHAAFARLAVPGREATVRFAVAFLSETFGHADLTPTPFGLSADGRLPVIVTPPSDPLDRRSAALGTSRPPSP